jgi:hypothetical protein
MIMQITIFIMKVALLYLMFPFLWINLTLFGVSIPKHLFETQPFFIAAIFVVVITAAISVAIKSKTPILWALLCVAYSAVFFIFLFHSLTLIAICLTIGAISFLYRSKITEPFLVLLPIIAGAWLFLQFVYGFCFVAWTYYITGQKDLGDLLFQSTLTLSDQVMQIAMVAPLFVMYLLGKHSYVKFYPFIKSLRK